MYILLRQHAERAHRRYILDVKQAVVSRDGNDGLKAFSTLGKKKEDSLWGSIAKNDCDTFWGVASSLLSPSMKSVPRPRFIYSPTSARLSHPPHKRVLSGCHPRGAAAVLHAAPGQLPPR